MSPRLSSADALIWRIEGDPILRSPILVVGALDRTPGWAEVRRAFEGAVSAIPRLRQRLVERGPGRGLRWVDDGDFALDHHLRRVRLPAGGGMRGVLDLVEPDVMTAFDPARPMWQLTLIEGLEGGRAAFALRFHHTISDGVGAVDLAMHLFTDRRRHRPGGAVAAAAPSSDGPSWIARAASAAGATARAIADPVATTRDAMRMGRSIVRMLAPAREPLSPLLVGRSLDRHLSTIDLPLAGLREAAHAAGATLNEAFLGAVGGALRDYHEQLGAPVDAVRVTMPVSVRDELDDPGGNRFTPVRFVLPVDEPDARRRVEAAGAIVRRWRAEPAVGLTAVLAYLLDRLPGPVVQRAFAGMLRSVDVDAVDVPGLRDPAYLGGALVERLWAFAPPTGAALSVTLVSHGDTACVAISCDRAAVSDPDLLTRCLEEGFDQVLALAHLGLVAEVPT